MFNKKKTLNLWLTGQNLHCRRPAILVEFTNMLFFEEVGLQLFSFKAYLAKA